MVAKMNPAYIKPEPELYYTSSDDDTDDESSYYSDNESDDESEETSEFSSEEDASESESDTASGSSESESDTASGSSDESISQNFAAAAIKDDPEPMLDESPKVRPREELLDDADLDSEDEYMLSHLPFKKAKSAEELVDKDRVADDVTSQPPLSHSGEIPTSLFSCDFLDIQPPRDYPVGLRSSPVVLAPATPEAVVDDVTTQPPPDLSADLPRSSADLPSLPVLFSTDLVDKDEMVDDVTVQPTTDLSADLPSSSADLPPPPVLFPANFVDKDEMADDVTVQPTADLSADFPGVSLSPDEAVSLFLDGIPVGCNDTTTEDAVINRFLTSFPTRESWERFARFIAEIRWPEEQKSLFASLKDKLLSLFKH